jgi:hypothetical protein
MSFDVDHFVEWWLSLDQFFCNVVSPRQQHPLGLESWQASSNNTHGEAMMWYSRAVNKSAAGLYIESTTETLAERITRAAIRLERRGA